MDLKKVSLGIGTTPASLPKFSNPRPSPPVIDAPRDGGGMSTGQTSGNFMLSGMTTLPNNAGAAGTTAGSEAAQAAFESGAK